MRSRRPSPQQAAAVDRRLAQLSAELAVVRAESETEDHGWVPGRAGARAGAVPPGVPDTHTRIRDSRLRVVEGPSLGDPIPGEQIPGDSTPGDPTPGGLIPGGLIPGGLIPGDPNAGATDSPPVSPPVSPPASPPVSPSGSRPAPPDEPLVPVPGRHAARRAGAALPALVPPTLRGRASLGPGPLAVLAVAVALGLAVTCWWVLRNDPQPLPAPVVDAAPTGGLITPTTTPTAEGGPSPAGEGSAQLVVDVAGKVRRPGIAVLPPGSRVVDALEAAGGARGGVDLSSLNLARLLVDGEQILVGAPPGAGPQAAPPAPGGSAAPGAPGTLVNINTADLTTLETLPGVGPVTAQSIIDWRTENGGFSAVEELLEVSGIGDATLAEIAPHVTV